MVSANGCGTTINNTFFNQSPPNNQNNGKSETFDFTFEEGGDQSIIVISVSSRTGFKLDSNRFQTKSKWSLDFASES